MPLPPKPFPKSNTGLNTLADNWANIDSSVVATPDHSGVETPGVPSAPVILNLPDPKPVLTAATKHDQGKTQWHLLPWDSVEEIVKVMEFGAGKYNPFNWMENGGFKYSRLFNSSMRHFMAWFWHREDLDPETGLSHLAHLGCNVLFLLHYVLNKQKFAENDDR